MTNRSGTLYVGVTNDIVRRVAEHRSAKPGSFTARYRLSCLVLVEESPTVRAALVREKQIKGWTRRRKLALVGELNPRWEDLAAGWFETDASSAAAAPESDPSLRSG